MYSLTITDRFVGRKLASILQSEFKMSRRLLRQLIESDGVKLNGQSAYLTRRVSLNDQVEIKLPRETSDVAPEPMDLDIRYEDAEIIVVNKPPGILTHPTARERSGSLLAGLRYYLLESEEVPHSVHRLDRDTSGVVMFAKHAHTHHLFDIALRESAMHREYVALVYYAPKEENQADGDEWQTISLSIAQDPNQPSRRIISTDGQPAITHYRVIGRLGKVAVVQLVLETGRTHQIRLHMATMGMPLLGDSDYTINYSGQQPAPADAASYRRMMMRQALHAYRLTWTHPIKLMKCQAAAPVAEDMVELWAELGGSNSIWDALNSEIGELRSTEIL